MIIIKNKTQIESIRESCTLTAQALELTAEIIKPGISTKKLDLEIESFILSHGAQPAFKGYHGFPASACISIDEEVVHGIPTENRLIEKGMLVSVDVGVLKNGFYGDAAFTFAIGEVSDEKKRLMEVTRQSLLSGINELKAGVRLGNLSNTIQTYVESNRFSVVRDLVGHGVGVALHEDPSIPNFGKANRGPLLKAGMVLAIEPMVNAGSFEVETLHDGWTVVTKDKKPSAHYEYTVLVTEHGYEVLTDYQIRS